MTKIKIITIIITMANREILLSLLKQLLDEKLQPLEKRKKNEIKDLGTLAVSMKTIEKNVKASCDMTNRIIEKNLDPFEEGDQFE